MNKIIKKKAFSLAEVLMCLLILGVVIGASMPVVTLRRNPVKMTVTSSPVETNWERSGSNIYNTNVGNIGINNYAPAYRFQFGTANTGVTTDQNVIMYGNHGYGSESIPSGAGTRLMWIPKLAAFRAGTVSGSQWDIGNIGDLSVALGGLDNIASGLRSTVVGGKDNTAAGEGSVVLAGENNIVTGNYSAIAGGSDHVITGNYSAIGGGKNNIVTTSYSGVIGGTKNAASGTGAIVIGGANNTASGINSAIIGGDSNNATNYYSFIASSTNSTAVSHQSAIIGADYGMTQYGNRTSVIGGISNNAYGSNSTAIGGNRNTVTSGSNYAVAGGYNMTASGNGTFLFGYNLSSAVTLNCDSCTGFYYNRFYLKNPSITPWSSDKRLKNIIGPYDKGLNEITQLHPIWFKYKNIYGLDHHSKQVGLIAQSVIKMLPDAKMPAPMGNGYYSYDFNIIQYAMINAMQELNYRNKSQISQINQISSQINDLSKDSNVMEARIKELKEAYKNQKEKKLKKKKNFLQKVLNWLRTQVTLVIGAIL